MWFEKLKSQNISLFRNFKHYFEHDFVRYMNMQTVLIKTQNGYTVVEIGALGVKIAQSGF